MGETEIKSQTHLSDAASPLKNDSLITWLRDNVPFGSVWLPTDKYTPRDTILPRFGRSRGYHIRKKVIYYLIPLYLPFFSGEDHHTSKFSPKKTPFLLHVLSQVRYESKCIYWKTKCFFPSTQKTTPKTFQEHSAGRSALPTPNQFLLKKVGCFFHLVYSWGYFDNSNGQGRKMGEGGCAHLSFSFSLIMYVVRDSVRMYSVISLFWHVNHWPCSPVYLYLT